MYYLYHVSEKKRLVAKSSLLIDIETQKVRYANDGQYRFEDLEISQEEEES